jgi:antitoxin component of MazEF toxin-antitoxin module
MLKNKVARAGDTNSIALPPEVLSSLQLHEGQEVWVEVDVARQRLVLSPVLSSAAFWEPATLAELSARQGVAPVTNLETLVTDFWPDDEPVEEFRRTVRAWRDDDRGV